MQDDMMIEAIADNVIDTPDQEFLEELRQEGFDTRKISDRVRSIILHDIGKDDYWKRRIVETILE